MSVLEIVFVGQCGVFVCLDFVHFFPFATNLICSRTGCQFFKKCPFFQHLPSLANLQTPLCFDWSFHEGLGEYHLLAMRGH